LRAGGSDTRHGNVSLVRESVELRDAARGGFDAATQQMIEHFDDALRKFESDVHEGKANVRVVSNRSGGSGGGSLDRLTLFVLLPLVVIGTRKLRSGRT
jgi:rhombotail lipoprotein